MDSPNESSIFAKPKKFFVHQAPVNYITEVPWLGTVDESRAKNQAQLFVFTTQWPSYRVISRNCTLVGKWPGARGGHLLSHEIHGYPVGA